MQNQAVLSLFASGLTTGTVVDCGDGISHTVPIYEGYAIPHAIQASPLAGRDLTAYLQTLLEARGYSFSSTSNNRELVTKIKEQECFVAQDYDAELKGAQETSNIHRQFQLASENITLSTELIKCPEFMFIPALGGKDVDGIQKSTFDSIMKCDSDIRPDLFKSIVLAGGSTMFEGMRNRMKKEIQALAPSPMQPEVIAPADRKFSCWLGAAILSKISAFDNIWITKKEWDDDHNIVHRKCF
jgi:actin-related protein